MGGEMTEADAGVAAARLLRCSVQNYDWGVKGEQSTVARLWFKNWGKEIEPDKPYAEFWMGTHDSGPSFLADSAAAGKTLKCWVSENPGVLGDRVVERWGNDIPFLFKVLSVAKALSIQAHPDRDLAKVLNKMRPDIYKDPNHKPEMAIAITEFKALCGFVSAKELKDVLSNVPEIKQLVGQEDATRFIDIKEEDGGEEVRAVLQSLFTKLMSASREIVSQLVVKLKSRLNEESKVRMLNEKEELALLLEKQYPDDIGVISSFFFNYVKLNPGEGLYIGANEPHAYVSGECIECMATSDNVVRAGLTPKYKDIQTLCSMLTYKLGFPGILQAIPLNPHISRYTPPFDEFEVDHCLLPAGESILYPAVPGPCLFVVMAGEGILRSGLAKTYVRAEPALSSVTAAMVSSSKASDYPSSRSKMIEDDPEKEKTSNIISTITQLKKQIHASRSVSIREKLEQNGKNLKAHTARLLNSALKGSVEQENMLSFRSENPVCKINGWESSKEFGDKESFSSQEETSSTASLVCGSNGGGRSVVRLVKLPSVDKIPPYTSWIFLDKNQRMAEDQSVVGRRRIYYDPYGNETLICSDSEEEIAELEEEKHEFSEGEDLILWKALQEHGSSPEVLDILSQFIEVAPSEIEERYETLMDKYLDNDVKDSKSSGSLMSDEKSFLDKNLSAALDSFDNLFCRRCLVFDCRLHGCSQSLVIPSEKQPYGVELEENRKPCGEHCYLKRRGDVHKLCHDVSDPSDMHAKGSITSTEKLSIALSSESEDSNPDEHDTHLATEQMCTEMNSLLVVSSGSVGTYRMEHPGSTPTLDKVMQSAPSKVMGKRKLSKCEDALKNNLSVGKSLNPTDKKQKIMAAVSDDGVPRSDLCQKEYVDESIGPSSGTDIFCGDKTNTADINNSDVYVSKAKDSFILSKAESSHGWSTMEKDLYRKGVEIFGKSSCLIARNLLSGLKTCTEVSNYMFNDGATLLSRPMSTSFGLDDSGNVDNDYMERGIPTRTRIWRRRGRARKLKYTWKSAGHPFLRKRIADGKHQSCKQYTPCGCQQMCGKECPCQLNATCCEKYCGCSKSCKNRFRGCHCAKSQCRSRQCPCFAAGRECDPDVCRNCWVSCGDGSLGEPPARGDGYQCGNMKLMLKQRQRILLAKSDVAGWGAFIKNPVNKNDYLGEYTGELISHREADKRGKIYDRANSSFLFDLNDQRVLDAYRKGDKLKFANHSSNPNCYAKVMLVAGDHRVGIFAKEHIEASEELFYDYRYGPDQAPAWARKPEGSKKDDSAVSHSRAHKVA